VWLLNCVTDSELRICVPMSDVINGQFDKGLKLLLGTGGKGSQMDPFAGIKQMTISAPRRCLHKVRPDRS
jgi:hypothetical protein